MLFKRKKTGTYDSESKEPVVRASICNGEQVAGFRDKTTGEFSEIMLVKGEADLEEFKKRYGITGEIKKIY